MPRKPAPWTGPPIVLDIPEDRERVLAQPAPPHAPTEDTRYKVRVWAQVGTRNHVICQELGISESVLKRHYADELAEARERGVANVAATLYAKALAGDVSAMTFFLKNRGRDEGWSDKSDDPTIQVTVGADVVRSITAAMNHMKQVEGRELPPSLNPPRDIVADAESVL